MDTLCAMDKIKSIHIIFKKNELYETFIIDSENKKIEEPIISDILINKSLNEQAYYAYIGGPQIYCHRCGINHNEDIEKLKKIDFQEYHEIIIFLKKNSYHYVMIKTQKNSIIIYYNYYWLETCNICVAAWPILEKLVNISKNTYYDFLNYRLLTNV